LEVGELENPRSKLSGGKVEIKLSEPKKKISAKTFLKEYPGSTFEVISMDNLDKFLL